MLTNEQEAVSFARDVYRELLRPELPTDWNVFLDCPSHLQNNGYFGAAYIQENNTASTVYIAHRGTSNIPDAIEDIQMWALSVIPEQFYTGAIPFIQLVFDKLDEKYPYPASKHTVQIRFTGHSLGATLAELSILKYIHYFDDKSIDSYNPNRSVRAACVFETPGSQPLVLEMLNSGETVQDNINDAAIRISIYNGDINAINTCMMSLAGMSEPPLHPGPNLQCAMGYQYSSLSPPKDPLPFVPGPKYFLWDYTVRDQHRIDYIYQWMFHSPSKPFQKVLEWPVGIDNAYIAYRTYYDLYDAADIELQNHNKYWKWYTQALWDQDPSLSDTYGNYLSFKDYYVHNELIYVYSPTASQPLNSTQNKVIQAEAIEE